MKTKGNVKARIYSFAGKHDTILESVLINAVILMVLLLLFAPSYDVNDDLAMCNMVDGSRGTYDVHLIFIHCAIGYLLRWLYMTFAIVPWYSVLQYGILFASFTALTWAMWKRITASYCRLAFLVLLAGVSYQGYIIIQFSRTASIASIAGVVLLLSGFFEEKLSIRVLVCGYILALLGSMYRFEQFLAVTALLSGIGVLFLLQLKGNQKWKQKLIRCFGVFAVLVVLVAGSYLWDRQQYSSGEWQKYMEFNVLRSELYDYGFPSYEENKEEYEKLGLDETAFNLLCQFVHLDPDRITADTWQKLVDLRDPKKIDGKFFGEYLRTILFNVYKVPAFFLALFVVVLWLTYNKRQLPETVVVIYELLLVSAEYFYLYYEGRYFRDRVDMGLWMAVAVVVFWLLNQENKAFTIRAGVTSSLILLLAGLYIAYPRFRVNVAAQREITQPGRDVTLNTKVEKQKIFEEIGEDEEHLYLTKVVNLRIDDAYDPFERLPDGIIRNLCPLGGWTSRSVSDDEILERYGVRNPFEEIVNNEKVYLVDNDIDSTINYIRQWYAPDAKEKLVKTIGDYSVYQVVEKRKH